MSLRNNKHWQVFITTIVILLTSLNLYLLYANRWPFNILTNFQEQTLGFLSVAGVITSLIIVLAVELIPLFLIMKIIEKNNKS